MVTNKDAMTFEDMFAAVARLVPERMPLTPPPDGSVPVLWEGPFVVHEDLRDDRGWFVASELMVDWVTEGVPALRLTPIDGDRPLFFMPRAIRKGDGPSVILAPSSDPARLDIRIRPLSDDDAPTLIGREGTADEIVAAYREAGL